MNVSVVMPTRDRRASCLAAIASALGQTAPPFEVLVCDDGSVDGTADAVEELTRADARVRLLRRPSASGSPAGPRNDGVRAARGEWIAFLDDDDTWLPFKLERQRPLLESGRYDVVAANASQNGGTYFDSTASLATPTRRRVACDNPLIMSTVVARRDMVLRAGGFREQAELAGIEDYLLWLELADRGARFAVLGEVLAVYATESSSRLSGRPLELQRLLVAEAARRLRRRPDLPNAWGALVHTRRWITLELRARRSRR